MNFQYTLDLADTTLRSDGKYQLDVYTPPLSTAKKYVFRINRLSVLYSWYNINANNNVLKTSLGNITVPAGIYDISSLLTKMTALLQVLDASFTATLSSSTAPESRKIKISKTGANFSLLLSQSTINKIIGFGYTDLTGNTTYTGTNVFSIGTRYVTFHSEHISKSINSRCSDSRPDYVCFVPVNTTVGGYIEYEPDYPIMFEVDQNQSINNDIMYFMDDELNIIDFNGIHPIINMEYLAC